MDWCRVARSRVGQIGFLFFTAFSFLSTFALANEVSHETHNFYFGKFNNDDNVDLFVQSKQPSEQHVIFPGNDNEDLSTLSRSVFKMVYSSALTALATKGRISIWGVSTACDSGFSIEIQN